jgi:hypothetical protein
MVDAWDRRIPAVKWQVRVLMLHRCVASAPQQAKAGHPGLGNCCRAPGL